MAPIHIVTDSGSDITGAEAEELGVTVVPLSVSFGEETFQDRELDAETFWQKAKVIHPRSSQPSVGAFEEVFASLVAKGAEVLCITITSKHSGTFNSAWAAAQRFMGKVTVFDSRSVSWGQRFQVLAALKAAAENKGMTEILAILRGIGDRVRLFAMLDTIEYLRKGGRAVHFISALHRVVGLLNIKPLLTMSDGEIKLLGVANSFARGLLRIEREVLALGPLEALGILHIRSQETAETFAQRLAAKLSPPLASVPILETGVALATHGGPGVIAALALPRP